MPDRFWGGRVSRFRFSDIVRLPADDKDFSATLSMTTWKSDVSQSPVTNYPHRMPNGRGLSTIFQDSRFPALGF